VEWRWCNVLGLSYVDLCAVVILEGGRLLVGDMQMWNTQAFYSGSEAPVHIRGIIEIQTYKLIYKSIPVLSQK